MENFYNKKTLIQNSFGGIIGNIMEWYDFAVFGYLASIISKHFFPKEDHLTALIMTYGIFATGYMMRPLGGIFFGFIGDKFGRKKALLLSIFMMALPTIAIGLLPTYEQLGIFAAILLISLRMIQGLSVGGELIGSVSFMVEIAPKNRKGLFGSFTLASAIGGLLLGSAVVMMLNIFLPNNIMYLWGWRIPFLSGVFILAIGIWLRERMSESPEFLRSKSTSKLSPLLHAFKYKKKAVLHLSGIVSLATVISYIMFVWMPTYLSDIITHPIQNAMTLNTLSMIVFLIAVPLAGYISDYLGHRKTMIGATIIVTIITLPLFMLLQHGSWKTALIMQISFAILSGFIQGPLPALMADMFSVNIRYTSIGIGYNISVAILGGTAPAVATWLIEKSGNYTSPAWYIIFFSIVSLLSLIYYKSYDNEK